jgi:hypothetical protein
MKIKPEELENNNFILKDKLEHKEMIPFVQTYIKKKTKYTYLYYFSNILALLIVLFIFFKDYNNQGFNFSNQLLYISRGLLIAFLLVPLHEYLHVIAYKSQGALKTSYDVNLKKFYFLAIADGFVANKKEFEIVALTPFLVISFLLLLILPFVSSALALSVSATLLMHTAMCSGDFGLLSYFEFYKDKEIVTYDDANNKISYFYEKVN